MSNQHKPYVLSIAGHDPCGGAGIIADAKTFEQCYTIGFCVATAITYQTEKTFDGVKWLPLQEIKNQLKPLLATYKIGFIKVGLIESLETLYELIVEIKQKDTAIKILWDPITKASAGFVLHNKWPKELLEKVLKQLYIITPNYNEAQELAGTDANDAIQYLRSFTNVYLKGGHNPHQPATDELYLMNEEVHVFTPDVISNYQKHGTGCVFSAALTAHLSNGFSLYDACKHSKAYITKYIESNESLLGYHNN